jgi:hypothetical protein
VDQGSMLWSQFSAIFDIFRRKKLAFFSKTNVMIKILLTSALIWVKNANFFAEFFGENIFKIVTSVPGFDRYLQTETNLVKLSLVIMNFYGFKIPSIGMYVLLPIIHTNVGSEMNLLCMLFLDGNLSKPRG